MRVVARRDIVTEKGFRIARRDAHGIAVKDVLPHTTDNLGKVLVFFSRRDHGYWCDPKDLDHNGGSLDDYIAHKEVFDPYGSVPRMPLDFRFADYHFGNNLKLCRKARKISQTELSRRMAKFGVHTAQSTICYRENQRYCPNGQFVDAIAQALQLPAWVFFVNLDNGKQLGSARDFVCRLSSALCEEST